MSFAVYTGQKTIGSDDCLFNSLLYNVVYFLFQIAVPIFTIRNGAYFGSYDRLFNSLLYYNVVFFLFSDSGAYVHNPEWDLTPFQLFQLRKKQQVTEPDPVPVLTL
jgi:hypothetical protein